MDKIIVHLTQYYNHTVKDHWNMSISSTIGGRQRVIIRDYITGWVLIGHLANLRKIAAIHSCSMELSRHYAPCKDPTCFRAHSTTASQKLPSTVLDPSQINDYISSKETSDD